MKSVDMSSEGLAEPLVDEVAFAALDVWANDHGYRKIRPNLMGF
jgi:formate dehydrogenase maturation protein FdhE